MCVCVYGPQSSTGSWRTCGQRSSVTTHPDTGGVLAGSRCAGPFLFEFGVWGEGKDATVVLLLLWL